LAALEPLSIAYITETSADDKHAWSGTAHYVYQALQRRGHKVTGLGPAVPRTAKLLLGSLNKISLKLTGRRFDYRHSRIYARLFGRIFNQKLRKIKYDCVVVCGGTEYGAYLRTDKPIYLVLDRTIAGAINYHLILQDLWPFSCSQSIYTDRKAMQKANRVFFSSRWAADHARVHYGIAPAKISVIPFGANIDEVPPREAVLTKKPVSPFRLLFIGSSWEHKGGQIALNALQLLLGQGHNVSLTVVGCQPPAPLTGGDHLEVIPFVDKNSPDGMAKFYELLLSHHVLVLPTRFDCTPIVFCEASAFALPVISAETGGVAAHVHEGVNGYLMPYQDKGPAYASVISSLISSPQKYETLRSSARQLYEQELNWEKWAEQFSAEIRKNPA
jgi:glycosyltransferase involved in cell wall biosynthesis